MLANSIVGGTVSRPDSLCLLPTAEATCAPRVCPLLPEGPFFLTAELAGRLTHPEASVQVGTSRQDWRLHWIDARVWPNWQQRVRQRQTCDASFPLPPCRVVEQEAGVWVVAAGRCCLQLPPWWEAPALDPLDEVQRLLTFLQPLTRALTKLHQHGFFWGNFDPSALETPTAPANQLHFTNLDLQLFPFDHPLEEIPLLYGYVAPEMVTAEVGPLSPATDVYRLGLFAYYWLARLLPSGFSGDGPAAFGFALPPLRVFAPWLPFGVAAVLSEALQPQPAQRTPTPAAFYEALQQVLHRARCCAAGTAPLLWEIGGHTRTGQAKSSRGFVNEDALLVRQGNDPPWAFAAVVDGISTADVGSGALASQMSCALLETTVAAVGPKDDFAARISSACHQASETLLSWALEHGHGPDLAAGRVLMGTTLTAVWLQGRTATLANLGDSRAYLIRDARVEQLTVDANVGSALLASGVPPENVADAEGLTRALRECIGGFTRQVGDRIVIQDRPCQPALTTWPLQAGDVLVLCTDGLVDEAFFLAPTDLAHIVATHAEGSAESLALRLVDAADALQRLPSPEEPYGCGDNICCVVIQVTAARTP